ncbi:translation initiation factor IF-2 [Aestuariivirga litoralis]|uniref:Translation initiation factor IF-2 n=1 Tax=Aestuariivirga litoralis TaxID=2650924 RepID=A0A2W2C6N7_9HYPH|nr:translation initiation factor IF-2 [Aestuariivirga litoralis]PZF75803.1 translation initiation factor IF-2 [Aestuariivirga litoralis]
MTDNNDKDRKPEVNRPAGGTLTLKRPSIEQSKVKQSFGAGRSKTVVVETKRKRFGDDKPATPLEPKAAPRVTPVTPSPPSNTQTPAAPKPQPTQRSGVVLRTLTAEEKEARDRALAGARVREAEDRKRQEEDAKRRAEQEARDAIEREAAARRKAEDDARHRAEEEARRKADEAAKKLAPKSAQNNIVTPATAPTKPVTGKAMPAPVKRTHDEEEAPRRTFGGPIKREIKAPVPARPTKVGEADKRRGRLSVGNALNEDDERNRSVAAFRRRTERLKKQTQGFQMPTEKVSREVTIPEAITIQELANRMAERAVDIIKFLMKQGEMHTINDVIDADTAQLVAEEMGHKVKRVSESDVVEGLSGDTDAPEQLKARPPVVTIMGHVDHGKTSLLDALRKTNVVSGEAGGITQHIGAYQVETPNGIVTFIDTPGHEAFTSMRARGAKATDIVVLVVAADDGVMPQTVEAINHARAADVPIIVAINKIDKPAANPVRVRNELLKYEIVVESMGGDTLEVEVSALKGTNLDKLLDVILLQSEVLDLKANPDREAGGMVVEAQLDKGRGPVATVLVQRGTLKLGDIFVAGSAWGRVRALVNDKGVQVKEASPSTPVEVLGLNSAPEAGDQFDVVPNEARAREVTEYRERKRRETRGAASARSSLEQMMSAIKEGATEFPILVKADVQGSAEAIVQALEKIGNAEIKARVIHYAVGGINESDIGLAEASKAVVLGFNVRASSQARDAAERAGIEIRYYNIIYDLVDDIKQAMAGKLAPELRETFLGNAKILEVFNITKVGKVAGCQVTEGNVQRGAKVRLIRDNVVIHEGTLSTLKRFKDEVKEVPVGQECGMAFENYQDIRAGDVIECFRVEKVQRTLD